MAGWTNGELITKAINVDYAGYEELKTFISVLYKGKFYSVSLIQKENKRKAVFMERVCERNKYWFETVKIIDFRTKEEGNDFYKKLVQTRKTSKSGNYYYTVK